MEKVKVKLNDVLNAVPIFNKMSAMTLPVKTSYWIGRSIKAIQKEWEAFVIVRNKLWEEYADRDENGQVKIDKGIIQINPEKKVKYDEEVMKLLDTDIELEVIMLTLDNLNGVSLMPAEINLISFLIKEK